MVAKTKSFSPKGKRDRRSSVASADDDGFVGSAMKSRAEPEKPLGMINMSLMRKTMGIISGVSSLILIILGVLLV